MEPEWLAITDEEGSRGRTRASARPESVEVRLEDGAALMVPRTMVTSSAEGYRFLGSFRAVQDGARPPAPAEEVVVPVVEERVVVDRRPVERDRVRLSTTVSTREQVVRVPLVADELKVERVPLHQLVEHPRGPWQDGETYVMPIYEEVLVVEKRLMLTEEVRVSRVRREHVHEERVALRREDVHVEKA